MTSSPSSPSRLKFRALSPEEIDRVRRRGVDDFGNALRPEIAVEAGAPLRCCLREAEAGERVVLIAHRPFAAESQSPYAEVGPVFIHADRCAGAPDSSRYPEAFRHRRQVLRAYDATGKIIDARLTEGDGAERTIAALFADPRASFVHSRNVLFGCYMFAIDRANER